MPFNIGPTELILVLVILAIPLALLAGLAFVVRRAPTAPVAWAPPPRDPRTVLAQRLADGEITRDEFDTAMHALGLVDSPG